MGDPSRQPADGKDDREHIDGDPDSPKDDAAVKVDVRIKLAIDKIIVAECDLLQSPGDVEQGIVLAQGGEQPFGGLPQHDGARVEVLVDPVAKAHQSHVAVLVLGESDVFLGGDLSIVHPLKHAQHLDVGSPVQGPPQRAHARRAGRK